MILDEITLQLRKDHETNPQLKGLYAFHVFGLIVLFIKEKKTQWPIMLRCVRGGLRVPNIIFEGYSLKPPYEFMLELFYFNKINYLVKDIKKDAMNKLFKKYGFKVKDPSISKNHDTLETFIKSPNYKTLTSKVEQKALDCQKMYVELLKNPKKYFKIDATISKDSKKTKDAKKKIKDTYLARKSFLNNSISDGKHSSADSIPKMLSKIKNKANQDK